MESQSASEADALHSAPCPVVAASCAASEDSSGSSVDVPQDHDSDRDQAITCDRGSGQRVAIRDEHVEVMELGCDTETDHRSDEKKSGRSEEVGDPERSHALGVGVEESVDEDRERKPLMRLICVL